jgi:hypothetical protein
LIKRRFYYDNEYKKIAFVLQGKGAKISMGMNFGWTLPINNRASLINLSAKKS